MNPIESWTSLSRHHDVVEKENVAIRKRVAWLENKLAEIKVLFPQMDLDGGPPMVPETPEWRPTTYRDPTGKFPHDIIEQLDWLSPDDFKDCGA